MAKEKKDKHFLKQPIYEGGPKAILTFINQHLTYPQEALAQRIEGTVIIKYTIDQHGDVIDTKVLAGVGHGCDEEAARVVRLLKFKVPKNRGLKVLFHKNIQVHFKLSQTQTPESQSIQYYYTPTPADAAAKAEDAPAPSGGGYSYTINV